MRFTLDVYRDTREFPSDERFGLTSQLRRAAVSSPSNIAEGHGIDSPGDLARFCSIALGSLGEAETQLLIARELGYIDHQQSAGLLKSADKIGRMLRGLIRSTRTN